MNQNCNLCGSPTKVIPAGISKKTGRAYQSFISCPNRCRQAPSPYQPTQTPPLPQKSVESPILPQTEAFKDEIRGRLTRIETLLKLVARKTGADNEEIDNASLPF